MKYQKELTALQEYIANFDPEEFSSSAEAVHSLVSSAEQRDNARRLKARLQRKRQLAETLTQLLDQDFQQSETIITQDEVDALLAGWALAHR